MGFLQIGMGMIIISQQPSRFREMNLRETETKIGCQTSITKGKYLSIKAFALHSSSINASIIIMMGSLLHSYNEQKK
jgi:hypothetical protein